MAASKCKNSTSIQQHADRHGTQASTIEGDINPDEGDEGMCVEDDTNPDEGNYSCQSNNENAKNVKEDIHSESIPNVGDEGMCAKTGSSEVRMLNGNNLPQYEEMSKSSFVWGEVSNDAFENNLDQAYITVMHWRKNTFCLPTGKEGNRFIDELTRLFTAYAEATSIERIALKAIVVFQALMLQKPSAKSKTRDHIKCLSRRMISWQKSEIKDLVIEGKTIQKNLKRYHTNYPKDDESRDAHKFMSLISDGKVREALRMLNKEERKHGVLNLDDLVKGEPVRDILRSKHPKAQPLNKDALVEEVGMQELIHPIIFEKLDGALIQKIALRMKGSGGPSGVDSAGWRRFCLSFGSKSRSLCSAIGAVGRRIATTFVDPAGLAAMTACRLIPLDKNPGVRPIGICDVVRRIISKAILSIARPEIMEVAGAMQLCSGIDSGCEAAVHAMEKVYEDYDTETIILVDATNAFNSMNRQTALRNIQYLCPTISTTLINMYRGNADLFTDKESFSSEEGTTQGDPPAIGITPLIRKMARNDTKQIWYADDAAAGGTLESIHRWWEKLVKEGPRYGYFPNHAKTWLVTKPGLEETAKKIFEGTGIQITTAGRPYLGAALGTPEYRKRFLQERTDKWKREIMVLSKIAITQPQAAYSSLTHGLLGRWVYLLRTMPETSTYFTTTTNAN
ncbi:Uncharacterised protein r2_g398 [Pycnogonum litorale]